MLVMLLSGIAVSEESAISERASSLFRQGRYEEVIQIIELARKSKNATADDLLILSVAYFNTNREDSAVAVLRDAEALSPENPQIQLALGSIALQNQQNGEAVERFRKAYQTDPQSAMTAEVLTAALVNHAAELAQNGERDAAFAALVESLEIDPSLFVALRNLAVLSLQDGNKAQAGMYAAKALELDPSDIDLHKIYLESLRGSENHQQFIQALNNYLELEPNDAAAHAILGRSYEQMDLHDDAHRSYERAEKLGTDDPYVYDRLASALVAEGLGSGSSQRPLSLTHVAIGQSIQAISRLKLSAAGALENRELTDLTEEDWERLEEMAKTLDEPLAILKRSLDRLRVLHSSAAELEADLIRLVDWYVSSVELKTSLASFYEENYRWHDSYDVWRRIILGDPNQATAHAGMARALLAQGNRDQARLSSRRALEVDAESEFVYEILGKTFQDDHSALRALLLERSQRDAQNPLLFEELAKVEDVLGLDDEAAKHRDRAELLRNW